MGFELSEKQIQEAMADIFAAPRSLDMVWSPYLNQAALSTTPTDISLGSIIISGLPTGAVVVKAYMFVKFSTKENTASVDNSISGAQNIQAQKHTSGTWVTGISFAGGEYATPAATREGGDVFMATADISSQIPANGDQVDFQWAQALAVGDNLNFNDIQVGLRVFYDFPVS